MDLRTNARLGLALALCFVAVACAAPAIPDGSIDDGSGAATATKTPTKKPPTNSSTAAPEGTPTTTTPPATTATTPPATTTMPPINASMCTSQARDACFDCCNQASGGALAPADNAFGQCACGGGQCTAVCDLNFCSGTGPDAACSSCLQATCAPAEAAACTSTACKAGLACAQQCP